MRYFSDVGVVAAAKTFVEMETCSDLLRDKSLRELA